ncbi:unnamed protein product [Effrenium voratum]|uniref:Phytanoyl-CoA dioxygenase n=1 Tax=Effrenium voratum TaxID=2562239 RepID=A0AA36JFX2_9DINO|nr:unnamed protein product [Effrenium voratum]CAJ1461713.1 unnamed protein product [Effrenium voratum]
MSPLDTPFEDPSGERWGVWQAFEEHTVRLCIAGEEVKGCFPTREEAISFQLQQLQSRLSWPRTALQPLPERSPIWDHPEELEGMKQYTFRVPRHAGKALDAAQLEAYHEQGFLLNLPVLQGEALTEATQCFEELLQERLDRAPDVDSRFRAAHTLSRPLHQDLVHHLATHERVLAIVEDVREFCCWSAHLFCKLPSDPTEQPWHQDAGFWPLSESRALTLWLAFDPVDDTNSAVTFVAGSHRLGRLPWQPTASSRHLLTQEIPDVDLLGEKVSCRLAPGHASIHSDLTVHGSLGNSSTRRRAGLALRFVACDAVCLGAMINGYEMNRAVILPKGKLSDPQGHWRSLKKRPGARRKAKGEQRSDRPDALDQ